MNGRYAACQILQNKRVAFTCWFEDAVAHYGVPTVLFDLHLLVKDVNRAEEVLLGAGWTPAAGQHDDIFAFYSDKECKPFRRLARPEKPNGLHIFLYNASDWGLPVDRLVDGGRPGRPDSPDDSSDDSTNSSIAPPTFFPSLPVLVDALIDSILDARDGGMVSDQLVMMLLYLYKYVPVVKQASFAEQLAYEHRQFHYDLPASHTISLRFLAHERRVRQQLRDGTLTPFHDPWNNERECLS